MSKKPPLGIVPERGILFIKYFMANTDEYYHIRLKQIERQRRGEPDPLCPTALRYENIKDIQRQLLEVNPNKSPLLYQRLRKINRDLMLQEIRGE